MSDISQLTTCWSHRREQRCGTDSKPTAPQGTGLRYWPQIVTRTMLSIMQHGRGINKTHMPLCPGATPQRHSRDRPKTQNNSCHQKENHGEYVTEEEAGNGKAPFLQNAIQEPNTACIGFCLQSVINIGPSQEGPGESAVIVLSAASLHGAPVTWSRNQEECALWGRTSFWSQCPPLVFRNHTTSFHLLK